METHLWVWLVAGISTLFSIILSAYLIYEHRQAWKNPDTQRYIVNIILMVPIFAINSFIGLIQIEGPEWLFMCLDSFKEIYEAYVIWSFLRLMFSYLHVSKHSKIPDHLKGREFHLSFPFGHLWTLVTGEKHPHMNETAMKLLDQWTLQFVVLRPILSVVSVGAEVWGYYDYVSWPICIALNISITVAVYALVVFFIMLLQKNSKNTDLWLNLFVLKVLYFSLFGRRAF